jgi:hypothetical protein
MKQLFASLAVFLLTALTGASAFAAQPSASSTSAIPPVPSIGGGEATGPLNCFDYYHFGSVQADLQPTLAQTVPGATLTFTGKIINSNDYALLNGTLYVKIFRRDEKVFSAGDGNPVVDEFVVADNVTLQAKGSRDTSFEWKVPMNAEGGEYYAAYFFTTSNRYNLMGLSFTDDVVGNQAPFTITNAADPQIAKLSKVETTLNGKDHHFAAFPLHFAAGDTVKVKTVIKNPSDKPKTVPLQWNQYAWDAMNKDNLRFTKTEVVTLAAGESKEVEYEVQPQRESVVYVIGVTQDNEAKSILNIRYVRDGIEETRINFPGINKFPLAKDTDTTLFACAHSTNLPLVPGNTLTLTLTDKDGKTIHEYRYQGDISGAMGGYGEVFKPDHVYNQATLTATLERNGVIVEQVKTLYDCKVIDPNSCLPEDVSASGLFSFLTGHIMITLLTIVIVLLIVAIAVFLYKKRKDGMGGGSAPTMTTPMK